MRVFRLQRKSLYVKHFLVSSNSTLKVVCKLLLNNPALALYIRGAATVLLLFIGIYNSWDTVTFLALERMPTEEGDQ